LLVCQAGYTDNVAAPVIHGTVFLTPNYVCFITEATEANDPVKKIVSFRDVMSVERKYIPAASTHAQSSLSRSLALLCAYFPSLSPY